MLRKQLAGLVALALLFAAPAFAQTEGAVAPGTAATRSGLSGCVYRSGAIAPADGQQMAVACDASGNLLTTPAAGGGGSTAANQTATQAPAAAGAATATKANLVAGTFITAPPTLATTNQSPLMLDANANLRVFATSSTSTGVDATSNAVIGSFGSPASASSTALKPLGTAGWVFNGTTWDRQRGDTTGTFVVEAGKSFTNISTNASTVIKASAGVFTGLIVNTAGATSSVIVYNNTTCTGAIIGTFSTLAQTALVGINASATVGICATTAGGTPANITILYR